MTWLEEFEKNTERALLRESRVVEEVDEEDWIAAHRRKLELKRIRDEACEKLKVLGKVKVKLEDAKAGLRRTNRKRQFCDGVVPNEPMTTAADCDAPENYISEDEFESNNEEPLEVVKIFYASRTHSQLDQVLNELKKTSCIRRFLPRVVTAISRQTLCANENVRRLKYSHLINEKCMELRKTCSEKEEGANFDGETAWGIRLRGNVLVLDEAHNVLETIGSLYSSEVTSVSTTFALSLIREYIDFYRSQLKSKNLMYMRQLLVVVAAMDQYLRKNSSPSEEVLTVQGFIIALGLTDVNLFKIVHYLDATDMCRKFHGFFIRAMRPKVSISQSSVARGGIAKLMAGKAPEIRKPSIVDDEIRNFPSPLFTIKQFLEALSNRCEDGRVIVERKGSAAKFRFILLNPATRLLEVVNESRATILVGGTMEPADLLVDCLSRAVKNGIRRFCCSHVIDEDQLLALSLGLIKTLICLIICLGFLCETLPRNKICFHVRNEKFTLTYETRNNVDLIKAVAESVMLLVREVPNGSVAFFTSYDYMSHFLSIMEKFRTIQLCDMRKNVFVESRASSEEIWNKFVAASRIREGAVLFAVAGGKLSEGINFSDELGRAVFMIGLPYPNKNSVELTEKMKNSRYTRQDVISRLPGWISKTIKCPNSFSEALASTKAFFQHKKH
ncbi:unnamed protein product [Angiostrongylus costaricensis]|uniref:Helicase ATP-binding domain-containing protein n=1 Tax=Angiostrongylus costaricensis TaxID=334426 RepID=A0A158PIK7_ANGCS|nr:unnamed protein product [Angiostrongylus costaricensis]